VTLLLFNRELVSRAKLCLVSVIRDIGKDCPMIRNLPKIFLRSFENVGPGDEPPEIHCAEAINVLSPKELLVRHQQNA